MKQFMPKRAGHSRRVRNSPVVRFAVADKNGGLVSKLRESFFNYLRNLCL